MPQRNCFRSDHLLLPSSPLSRHLVLPLPLVLRPEPAGLDLAAGVVVGGVAAPLLLDSPAALPQQEAPDGSSSDVTRSVRTHLDLPLPGAAGVPAALASERGRQLMT